MCIFYIMDHSALSLPGFIHDYDIFADPFMKGHPKSSLHLCEPFPSIT